MFKDDFIKSYYFVAKVHIKIGSIKKVSVNKLLPSRVRVPNLKAPECRKPKSQNITKKYFVIVKVCGPW